MNQTSDTQYMDVKEFRERGYLQELNRRFLHPLGLAIAVNIQEDGTEQFDSIIDYRNDPEGMIFTDLSSEASYNKFEQVNREWSEKAVARITKFGFIIQPIGHKDGDINRLDTKTSY